jgi:ribose transport system permease protein
MKSDNSESVKSTAIPSSRRILQALERPEVNRVLILAIIAALLYYVAPMFFRLGNLELVLAWGSIFAIMAMGEMLALLVGGFDLSVEGMVSLSSVWAAILMAWYGIPVWLAILVSLLTCMGIGFMSGYFSTYFSPPYPFLFPVFIFTLTLHFVLKGMVQGVTGALPVTPIPSQFGIITGSLFNIPLVFIYMIVIAGLLSFFLYFKPIGWKIFATGQDDEAARYTGVNTTKVRIIAYMGSATLIGFGGILAASRLQSASFQMGEGYLLTILAATIIGGVSLSGGEGSPIMAIIGGFLIYLVQNLVVALGVSSYLQNSFLGILIIIFVSYDFIRSS